VVEHVVADRRVSGRVLAGCFCDQFLLPVVEEPAQLDDVVSDWDVDIVESCERAEHRAEDGRVEAGVDLRCAFDHEADAVAARKDEDVSEVAGFGAVEEGEQLAAGEFFQAERGPGDAGCRGQVRRGVKCEVEEEILVAGDDERQKVSLSRIRRIDRPRSAAAFSNASRAPGTVPRPARVNRSRS
jgi:hypothetical protein